MKWFIDTEFNENGKTIELISIALVNEHGHGYYAISTEFDPAACNDWVKANVLTKLGERHPDSDLWKSRSEIAEDVKGLLQRGGAPEIWGYFSDYDWVAFCQLFGCMIDLPDGFPMYCLDLKQEMHRLGVAREQLPEQAANEHNALADAFWIRSAWLELIKLEEQAT